MQKLTIQEFEDRIQAVARARKIFIEGGITRNISHAFALYQEVLADIERALELQTDKHGNRMRSQLDQYERPKCPLCEAGEIMFSQVRDDPDGYQSNLMCASPGCNGLWKSKTTIHEWGNVLRDGQGREIDFTVMDLGSKKAERKAKAKSTRVDLHCPKCRHFGLYELEKCCGAPEGLVECELCDFQEDPSIFYGRS